MLPCKRLTSPVGMGPELPSVHGFSRDRCRGRGSSAAPSPTTPSWLEMQSGRTQVHVVKLQGSDPPWKGRFSV
jgi:hypothetical protein